MPTRISEYRISVKNEEILISADSFTPYKLEVAKDVIVRGNMYVHGDAGCATLRGGNMANPILLQSNGIDISGGERFVFVSPIEGLIKRASLVVHAGTGNGGDGYNISFFNEHGIKASTILTVANPAVTETAEYVTFNWADPNDLAFCSVGVDTVFSIYVYATTIIGTTIITIGIEIVPLAGGGLYV